MKGSEEHCLLGQNNVNFALKKDIAQPKTDKCLSFPSDFSLFFTI